MAPEIGVVHMDLMSKGGGEAVAMNVLEALQDDYDVTLLTLAEPDFGELNEYFNTNVDSVDVELAGRFAPTIHERSGIKYYILQNALLGRYARRNADEYDLVMSTINELGLESDSIQYIHFPFDWTVSLDNRDHIFHPTVESDSLYERLCTSIAGVSREDIHSNTLFANSRWTADVVEDAYGTRPDVLHPPIDTEEFDPLPWDEREYGFVTLGRIERSKRIVEQIHIMECVRERGHDVHFHIVGPTVDEEYRAAVEAMAEPRDYVFLEGELPREDLVDLVCSHRFGIHGKRYEHFGMAVAEIAAGGALPFAPSDGGQHAIVHDDERLLYDSVDDAVKKIDDVLSRPQILNDLRISPQDIEQRFGRARFKEEIRETVAAVLDVDDSPARSTEPHAMSDRRATD